MLRVPIHKIEPGMVLARPIPQPNDPFRYLLQRDREISPTMVSRLEKLGILEVWVRYPKLEFLEDVIEEGLGDRQREVYWHVRRNFETIMDDTAAQIDLSMFQTSITGLFDFMKQSRRGNILLQKLDAFDNVLMSHSTNVCYLSLMLGMQLEQYLIEERRSKTARDAKDLKELGLGCLLHDIGKMLVPPEILNKPDKLTDDEYAEMKRHPVYGYEMLKGSVPAVAAQIVLNHHQRYEGDGYPTRVDRQTGEELPALHGRQIPVVCRIATVCDVFDAATTARCYSHAKPTIQVLHEMHTCCNHFFDPTVLRAFTQIVPPFPIGQLVTLSDGTEAAVVDFNSRSPVRPKVQGIRTASGEEIQDPSLAEIDLAIHPDVEIASVDDVDVREFTRSLDENAAYTPMCV